MITMGLLDRFIKQEVQQIPPEQIAYEERQQYEMQMRQQQLQQSGELQVGQHQRQQAMAPMPPTMDKEVMDHYLTINIPANREKLTGTDRLWMITNNKAAEGIPTSNNNAGTQERFLEELTTGIDFSGTDNTELLVDDTQIKLHAYNLTNKSRSDFGDGLRERVIPSVGIGMAGTWNGNDGRGERPRESRGLFGLGGHK
jgi:hypothetical protein